MSRVLLIEYFTSGGSLESSPSMALEGYAMLRAVAWDLWRSGFKLAIALDRRAISSLRLPPSIKIKVEPGSLMESIRRASSLANYALIIAPPMAGIHASLTALLEELGLNVLGPSASRIAEVTDKARLMHTLSSLGLRTPKTVTLSSKDLDGLLEAADELGYPMVIKPRDGAGCEGIYVVSAHSQLELVARGIVSSPSPYIAQEAIRGIHASVSLISNGHVAKPLSLNAQFIEWGFKPEYLGGLTPLNHHLAERVLEESRKCVEALRLKGYVGVDVVIDEAGPCIVEVNPRLTTSYVAVTSAFSFDPSLGACIVKACAGDLDPRAVTSTLRGYCALMKVLAPREVNLDEDFASKLWSFKGVYAVAPLTGLIQPGLPVALVRVTKPSPKSAERSSRLIANKVTYALQVLRPQQSSMYRGPDQDSLNSNTA